MHIEIEILDEAQEDLLRGAIFYESQRYGLGEYFLDAISTDIDSLYLYAGVHPKRFDFYMLHAKRFPYTVYYRIENEKVRIYAVLDDRQNPKKTEERLG